MTKDVITLTQKLISFESITPRGKDCLNFIQALLEEKGFICTLLPFEDVTNLYARYGSGKNLCFAGHIDVVPPGDSTLWAHPPFKGTIQDGLLYGRGAADMKGGVAASLIAAFQTIEKNPNCSISFLLTSDEEGPALHGTQKVVRWLQEKNEKIDACIVAEPTSSKVLGDMIKVGRRASLTGHLTLKGTQGHVAYPHLAQNPVRHMVEVLHTLQNTVLDEGYENFSKSNLEITSIDVGNPTCNIIPNSAKAIFNVRYNPSYSKKSLMEKLTTIIQGFGYDYDLTFEGEGDPFYTNHGPLVNALSKAIHHVTGVMPEHSTSGGTSDARFIKDICPVVEFGLCNTTIHKVDECTPLEDLENLTHIYKIFLETFFKE